VCNKTTCERSWAVEQDRSEEAHAWNYTSAMGKDQATPISG